MERHSDFNTAVVVEHALSLVAPDFGPHLLEQVLRSLSLFNVTLASSERLSSLVLVLPRLMAGLADVLEESS